MVLASRRKPGKGSRKELVLNIGQHESVGAAIKAWTSEADACRREATRLARLGGERATANAEKLREHAERLEEKIEKAKRLPPVTPCRCGRGRPSTAALERMLARLRVRRYYTFHREGPVAPRRRPPQG